MRKKDNNNNNNRNSDDNENNNSSIKYIYNGTCWPYIFPYTQKTDSNEFNLKFYLFFSWFLEFAHLDII